MAPIPAFLADTLAESYQCHTSLEDGEEPLIRALVGSGTSLYREGLLQILPQLEHISVYGPGYGGVPLDYCRKRGIKVSHTPDIVTDDIADIAMALVLMTSRRLVEASDFLHAGRWPEGTFPPGSRLSGKCAGILGLGRVGKAVGRRLEACGMRVGYTSRIPQIGATYPYFSSLHDLAFWCDFLIVACPGGSATRHLVNASVLEALGSEGTLINISRGSVVDEEALVYALEHKLIRTAGLDVFEKEPLVPDELVRLPQVVLLPHLGSSTRESRQEMARLVIGNLDAHFQGSPLLTPVPELRVTTQRRTETVTLFSSPAAATASK
ncbi:MAG: 2-hydroxyacid dehydrogenase [Verrucomicrobium sp.]